MFRVQTQQAAGTAQRAPVSIWKKWTRASPCLESERLEAVIQDNETAHNAAGHWGVPTAVFEGEPFFGQDRLDVLLWRLQGKGLRARGET